MMPVMVAQLRAVLDDASVGTVAIGRRRVRRLGFGAMRISRARNAEGLPDRGMAVELVLGARDRGVQFFDTANIYGLGASEEILAAALAPYADDVLIATKAGFQPGTLSPGQRSLPPQGRPEHIREECDRSLRRLRVDCIDLYQVHVPDPEVPWAETVGAFAELQQAGKVRAVGVSNVTLEQLREAQAIVEVGSVQNRYSVGDRRSERVLEACEEDGIAFLPWAPILGVEGRPVAAVVDDIAASRRMHKQQVALAWLLQRSPVILPIPGTSQLQHVDENVDAAWLRLSNEELARLDIARPHEEQH
jgi:aryl-alcohol dehydrogenase-like predicted oxidoreductase